MVVRDCRSWCDFTLGLLRSEADGLCVHCPKAKVVLWLLTSTLFITLIKTRLSEIESDDVKLQKAAERG